MLLFEERQREGQWAWGHLAARFGQVHSLKTIKELLFSYSKNMENMWSVGVMFTICIETMQIFWDMTRTVFFLVKKNLSAYSTASWAPGNGAQQSCQKILRANICSILPPQLEVVGEADKRLSDGVSYQKHCINNKYLDRYCICTAQKIPIALSSHMLYRCNKTGSAQRKPR